MFGNQPTSNIGRAEDAWGADMPAWVRLLASACDTSSQKAAGQAIGYSGATVSKVLNRVYPGSYEDVAEIVRARFGEEDVVCPIWGEAIPLAACMEARGRKGPPRNAMHKTHDRQCPTCPNNTDAEADHGL